MPSAIGRSATARFEGYNSHFGAAGTPSKGAIAAAKGATPAKQSTPAKTATPSRTPSKAIPKLTPSQVPAHALLTRLRMRYMCVTSRN